MKVRIIGAIVIALILAVTTASAKPEKCFGANAERADFDGDGRTDLSVFRPTENSWYILRSKAGFMLQSWGLSGDQIVPADYDCDGKTDMAVFRPNNGTWYCIFSSDNNLRTVQWGLTGDSPVPADYDGDGKDDFAVWRMSDGRWYIFEQGISHPWGLQGDVPVPGDYNGDGKADLAVYRWWPIVHSTWYLSINGVLSSIEYPQSGFPGHPVPADYDGDGTTDLATFGGMINTKPDSRWWQIQLSGSGFEIVQSWGLSGDEAVPGDYDGDASHDIGVFRASEGRWYLIQSSAGVALFEWGLTGDKPIPHAYYK